MFLGIHQLIVVIVVNNESIGHDEIFDTVIGFA